MANGECPFYESVRAVLGSAVSDKERRALLKKAHVDNTLLNAINLKMGEKAADGDVQAAKYLRETAMTKPCAETEGAQCPEGFDLSALTDEELRSIAAKKVQEA